jgi:RHS repeat-associated protein
MKKYFIFTLLTIAISCNCQNKDDLFNQFVKKFKECSLPITNETYKKFDLYPNNPCNVTKLEFDLFIKNNSDNDRFWIYSLYSKKNPNYFNYVTGLRFPFYINNDLIILIYFRDYSTEDYIGGKTETILSIFSKKGNIISKIPIAGGYGDTLTFDSKIYSPEKIEINYTKSSEKGEKKYAKYYCIQKDGKIVLKK